MNAIEVAQRYIDAWNRHDADAIVASFAEGGTYNNPDAGQGLTGEAIADFAKGVFAALPDVSFEIVSIGDSGGGLLPTSGCYVAPTPGRVWTIRRLPVAVFGCRARHLFR